MKQQGTKVGGRVTLSINEEVLLAARALLAAEGKELSPLVEELLREHLKKEGFPTELTGEQLKAALKGAASKRKSI